MLYLVTGGAGFIGSHLCDELISLDHDVRVLDDFSTGRDGNLPAGVHVIRGDVADPATALQATDGVDGVFHLAAVASVQRCAEDLLGTHRTNLGGMLAILEAIRTHGTKIPVVYASSAAVYGNCLTLPISEDAEKNPMSAYGADKLCCELHARTATIAHGIPTFGLRFFNVYGPRQDPKSPYSGVISIFLERIATGQPVIVHGDGEQTRDFIYVRDVVNALSNAMNICPTMHSCILNVCTGRRTTINVMAATLANIADMVPCTIEHHAVRHGDIRHSYGNNRKMRGILAIDKTISLDTGLVHLWASRKD